MKRSCLAVGFLTIAMSSFGVAAAQTSVGCGDDSTQFKVSTAKHEDTAAPKQGMARLVLFQKQEGPFNGQAVSRFAVDGKWVGADKGTSYFVVDLQPGQHIVCASRQTSARADKVVRILKVDATAGQTYYLEFHVQRMEVGDASISHAGMNGALATAGKGYTPDMTLRQKDTVDAGDFLTLEQGEAMAAMHKAPVSTATAK